MYYRNTLPKLSLINLNGIKEGDYMTDKYIKMPVKDAPKDAVVIHTLKKKSFVLGDYTYHIGEDKTVTLAIVLPGVAAPSIKVFKTGEDLVVEAKVLDILGGLEADSVKYRYTLPKYSYSGTSAVYKNGILTVKLEAAQVAGDEIPVTIGD